MEARSQRATVSWAVLVAALVIAGVFAPVAVRAQEAAPAAARSLTVTPSTDLDDGHTVSVDGTGWRPGALVAAVECLAGTQTCGGAVANRPVDTDGTFTMSLAVRAVFTAFDGTPVDCRVDACEVTAVNEENEDHTASVLIAFDPATVLLPPPTLIVTPDADLVEGQTVTVAGAGYLAGTTLFLAQCRPGQPTMEGCGVYRTYAETDGSGAFSAELRLVATFFHPDGTVDCRAEACELVVATFFGGVQARAAIAFDPDGPLTPPPTLTVTPDEGLTDGQTVTVVGTGFLPGTTMFFAQCRTGQVTVDGCVVHQTYAEIDGAGAFSAELPLVATFFHPDGTVDCRAEACGLAVATFFGGVPARGTTAFDPDGPLAPPPTLTVTPDEGLTDGQTVTVTGTGFTDGGTVVVLECGDLGQVLDDCAVFAAAPPIATPTDGTFEVSVTVHRRFDRFSAGDHDCDLDPCVIRAFSLEDGRELDAAIAFAPEATDGPTPAAPVAVTPAFAG